MRISRRRIGAFARAIGANATEYFDPVIASYDGYRDVIAPAVFMVVPGQPQLTELIAKLAPERLALLHGVHIEIMQPIVAAANLTVSSSPMRQRISGDIGALTVATNISDDGNQILANVTQKLALVTPSQAQPSRLSRDSASLGNITQNGKFEIKVNQRDLLEYVTVSDDTNPIHTDPVYAQQFGYQSPIAQGMLLLGKIISQLEDEIGKYLIPKQIWGRFIAPVAVPPEGASVIGHITQTDNRYELTFTHNNQRIARVNIFL